MAELKKIKQTIADLVSRRTNVTAADIAGVMGQLSSNGFKVTSRKATHGILYNIENLRFMVCIHNPGSKHLKSFYVRRFADVMMELELYGDD